MVTEALKPNGLLKDVHSDIFAGGVTEATQVLYGGKVKEIHRSKARLAILTEGKKIIDQDAVEFVKLLPEETIDGVIFDQAAAIEEKVLRELKPSA